MKKCLLPLAAVACWAACQPASFAQPIPLPPIIASDTILDPSEYIVVDQTLVDPGARLTVPPGAIIRFQNPDSSLNVFGSLLAIGTPDSRVVFTSAKSGAAAQPGDWGEVYINANPSAPPTILQHCEFSFGGGQVALDNAAARVMLRVESYPVLIEDCTFSRAFGSGAGYFGPPSQTFTRCAFLDNVYGGVAALNPSRANINLVDCIVGGNYIALMGVWRPEDFAGSSGNVFANTYNAVVLAAGGTVPTGETVTISSPPVETGLLGIIEGSYTVEQDGTLQVAPEARIYFTAGARILVSGAFATSGAGLVAHKGGARGQEVNDETAFAYFSAIPSFKLPRTREELAARPSGGQPAPPGAGGPIDPAQVWRGITFLRDADDARSVVQHLWLDRADVALTFDRASVRVDGCTVSNVVNAGVRVGTAAHPEISRSLITNSLGDGIVCERDAAPALSRTTITGSRRAGLVIRDEANPMLLENIIVGNRDGVEISGTAAPVLGNIDNHLPWDDGRNIIVDNTRWALANYTPNRIMAQNIFWGLHQASEIDKVIFDDDENPAMGQVVFLPLLGQNPTPTVPVSPTPTPTPAPYQLTPSPTPTTPVETFLSGTLNSDLTLSGVVRVTGSVTVQGFAALRFLPGTIVRIEGTFDALSAPETAVYIRARNGGRIGVEGTRDQPVVFTTVNDNYWGGLSIEGPEWVTSSVRYAHVQRALVGLDLTNTAARVEQCRFQYCRLGVSARRTTGAVDPILRANLFMENLLGFRSEGGARPDLGTTQSPGGNVFYINTTDAEIINPAAPVAAIGNYWSEAGPDGEVVRLEDQGLVRARRISGDNSPAGISLAPIGEIAGGQILNSDVVWLGTVDLTASNTIETEAVRDGQVIRERALHVGIDSRLRILPGTIVQVQPRRNIVLLVSGRLDAIGTPARPIVFRSAATNRQPTDWRGVRFIDGADLSEPSVMRYCEVSDAYTGVSVINRSPLLEFVKIRNFADQGVLASSVGQYARKGGAAAAAGNPFGIARPRIADCQIVGGEYGLVCLDAAPVVTRSLLTSSIISSVYITGNNVPDLGNLEDSDPDNDGANVIGGSIRYDIENLSTSAVRAQNNFWGLIASDDLVDARIFDDNERYYSGKVIFLPRQGAVPPNFLVAGDLDGNGRLDSADLAALSAAWRSVVGDPQYRPQLDVDRDYQIDKNDLLFISNRLTQ